MASDVGDFLKIRVDSPGNPIPGLPVYLRHIPGRGYYIDNPGFTGRVILISGTRLPERYVFYPNLEVFSQI